MSLITRLQSQFKIEFGSQLISVLSGAILTVVLANTLSTDKYGLLFLSFSIFGVVKLFSRFGIDRATARYITKYKEKKTSQIPHILKFGFLLNIVSISLSCIVLLVFHLAIVDLLSEPRLSTFLLFGILFIFFSTLAKFTRSSFQGFEDIKAAALVRVIDRVVRLLVVIFLVILGYGALGALFGYIFASALTAITGLIYVYKKYYFTPEIAALPDLRKKIAKYTLPLTATSSANIIDKRVDTILVGFFLDPTAVAFYTLGKQVVSFIEAPMSALGFTLSPTFEAEKAKGNLKTAARIYEQALVSGLQFYIPAAAGLALIAEPMVRLVFGGKYSGAVPVIQIMGVYAIALSVAILTSNSLDFLGRARARAKLKISTSILNAILNILLIPSFGVEGAAIATVLTFWLFAAGTVYVMSLEFDLRKRWVIKRLIRIIGVTVGMSLSIIFVNDSISGYISLIMVIALGIIVWFILSLATGLMKLREIVRIVR